MSQQPAIRNFCEALTALKDAVTKVKTETGLPAFYGAPEQS